MFVLLSGSIRVSNLIVYKTLLKISLKCPSFLPHVLFSVLFNEREQSSLLETDTYGQTDTGTDLQDSLQTGVESDS